MVGKMGILARSLPENLTISREILTFEIKKYIRNSGKFDYLAGKNTLFQAVRDGSSRQITDEACNCPLTCIVCAFSVTNVFIMP